jgi:hypothetical protein
MSPRQLSPPVTPAGFFLTGHAIHAWQHCLYSSCENASSRPSLKHQITALLKAKSRTRRSKMTVSTKPARNFISRALAVFGAAASAAAAVEGRRRPHERDLRTLGINPADLS